MMLCGACGSIIFQCSSHVHLFLNSSAFADKTAIWNRSPNRLCHHNSHWWCRHALYDSLNWSRFAGFYVAIFLVIKSSWKKIEV
jgi:hypothetical protein